MSAPFLKLCVDDFSIEYEVVSLSTERMELKEINKYLEDLSQQISKIDTEIEKLTNHADKIDYIIAVASGILNGIIDSFYVGEIDWNKEKGEVHKKINQFIEEQAKRAGYNGNGDLKDAIAYLEKKYKLPTDNIWKKSGEGNSLSSTIAHHLDDLAHHPTPFGLIACLLSVMFKVGIFVNKNGKWKFAKAETDSKEMIIMWSSLVLSALCLWLVNIAEKKYEEEQLKEIPKPIRILLQTLASAPAAIVILRATNNWIGHLISDMGGSKQTADGGMGIPGLFLSFLKELSSIPPFNQTSLPKVINDWYTKDKFDMRAEATVLKIAKKQAVPVILNEVIVRGFYFIRRIIGEAQKHGKNFQNYDWEKTIPASNRTVVRMLTIAHGTFVAFDLIDAAARTAISGEYVDPATFLAKMALRVNFVGVGRFTIAIYSDVKMGVQRKRKIYEKLDLQGKKLNFYNAKIYYKQADMWVEASNAEQEIAALLNVEKIVLAEYIRNWNEMDRDVHDIGNLVDDIEKEFPEFKKDILSILE